MIKEKWLYYNPIQKGYYLVLSTDNEMIYGIRGIYTTASQLEDWINQDGSDICFKIGEVLIFKDYIRNYFLDEEDLKSFEPIKELTDKEFSIIETIAYSDFPFPPAVIDVDKLTESIEIELLVRLVCDWKREKVEIDKKIRTLEEALYLTIYKEDN
jgi:hypothetical protein